MIKTVSLFVCASIIGYSEDAKSDFLVSKVIDGDGFEAHGSETQIRI